MNWANIGKKLVAAKKAGKNLNKVPLGKYEPEVQRKRGLLAKTLKKKKTLGFSRKQLKNISRHPERHSIWDEKDRKVLGPRKTRHYSRGGKVK